MGPNCRPPVYTVEKQPLGDNSMTKKEKKVRKGSTQKQEETAHSFCSIFAHPGIQKHTWPNRTTLVACNEHKIWISLLFLRNVNAYFEE